jgi:HEAT repeat protein
VEGKKTMRRNIALIIFIAAMLLLSGASCSRQGLQRDADFRYNIRLLSNNDARVRETAAYTLAASSLYYREDEVGKPAIALAEDDPDDGVRIAAYQILDKIYYKWNTGDAQVVLQGLDDANPDVRKAAYDLGCHIGWDDFGIDFDYFKWLHDKDPEIRESALGGVGLLYDEMPHKVLEALTEALEDEAPSVRFTAAETLIRKNSDIDKAFQVILAALDDRELRWQAISFLENIGPKGMDAVPKLKEVFNTIHPDKGMIDYLLGLPPDADVMAELRANKPGSLLLKMLDEKDPDWVTVEPTASGHWARVKACWNDGRREEPNGWNQEVLHREGIIEALAKISPDEDTVEFIIGALNDEDEWVRGKAAEVLSDIDGAEGKGLARIIEMTGPGETDYVRWQSMQALGKYGRHFPEQAVPVLIDLLRDEDCGISRGAAEAIGQIGPEAKDAASALWELVDKYPQSEEMGDYRLALELVWALWKIESERSAKLEVACKLAGNANPDIRSHVMWLMWGLGPEAIPRLVEGLDDSNAGVRSGALWSLGKLGEDEPGVVKYLIQGLNDPDPEVGGSAASALKKLGIKAKDAAPALAESLKEYPSSLKRTIDVYREGYDYECSKARLCIDALGAIGPDAADEAIPVYSLFLSAENVDLVLDVIENIPRLGTASKALVQPIAGLLLHENAKVRLAAAKTLGQMQQSASDAVPSLVKALDDANPGVRWEAAKSLGLIGNGASKALPALRRVAQSDINSEVRRIAGEAVGKIEGASAQ